eukprot:m.11035 g.11035  ORF g.11035 m.11035 type:complete len:352 (+) comp14733_c0_seq1:1690-2745(+)
MAQHVGVAHRHQTCRLAGQHLQRALGGGREHGPAGAHGLQDGQREGFLAGRRHEQVEGLQRLVDIAAETQQADARVGGGHFLQLGFVRAFAEDGQHGVRRCVGLESSDQQVHALAAVQAADAADQQLVGRQAQLGAQIGVARSGCRVALRRPVVDDVGQRVAVGQAVVLGAVHADEAVQARMVVGLVADVQGADARRAAGVGNGLAGRAEVAVADVGTQAASQRGNAPAAQQRQGEAMELHALRQRTGDGRAGRADDVDTVAQRGLGVGEVDAMPLTARDPGRKHDVNQGQRYEGRGHGRSCKRVQLGSVSKTLPMYTFRNLSHNPSVKWPSGPEFPSNAPNAPQVRENVK